MAENRSPNSIEPTTEAIEDADIGSKTIAPDDKPTKESLRDLVCGSEAKNVINLYHSNDEGIGDTVKPPNCDNSMAEFEALSTRSQNKEVHALGDISGQCLNTTIALSNGDGHGSKGNNGHSMFGGNLERTDNEFIDMKIKQNIFNVYSSDGNANGLQTNAKQNPLIQVLSESECTDLTKSADLEATNALNLIEDANDDRRMIQKNFDAKNEEKPLEIPKSSSSTITFYCANLDGLKEIGSDSDADIEEIV